MDNGSREGWRPFQFSQCFILVQRSVMQISLCTMSGHQYKVDVSHTATLGELHTHIDTASSAVLLVLGNRILPDIHTLSFADVGITDGAIVNLVKKPAPHLLTASFDKSARIWNSVTEECLQTLSGHINCVVFAVFSPDGRLVLTVSHDDTAKVWSVTGGNCMFTFSSVTSAVFLNEGNEVISSTRCRRGQFWSTDSGECVANFSEEHPFIRLYSACGSTAIAEGSVFPAPWNIAIKVYSVNVWNITSGLCTASFSGHSDFVETAVLSSDAALVLTASWDHTAQVWTTNAGECLCTFQVAEIGLI